MQASQACLRCFTASCRDAVLEVFLGSADATRSRCWNPVQLALDETLGQELAVLSDDHLASSGDTLSFRAFLLVLVVVRLCRTYRASGMCLYLASVQKRAILVTTHCTAATGSSTDDSYSCLALTASVFVRYNCDAALTRRATYSSTTND
ncbi:hypothetical protein OH76DRAFT_1411244 [Lentinus brumalis]|uniref:Uncharacterized protein n=1 Tax=Lentinus brumalis TaxID=2498619 RepID=A0A371CQ03_9APHY|nr:hypothetical protein OH76DRAFT_1411244 [Polyporus brumalis]